MKVLTSRLKALNLSEAEKVKLEQKFKEALNNGFRCKYCNNKMDLKGVKTEYSFTIDHTHPRCRGGRDLADNLEFVCQSCNLLKSDLDADYFLANLNRLKQRKLKNELFKATRKKDDGTGAAYRQILKLRAAR